MPATKTVISKKDDAEGNLAPNLPADFAERVRLNQENLTANLKRHYDFIVCGSGSSGSVVARRLAENPYCSVTLLESVGSEEGPNVTLADQRVLNLRHGASRN